MADEVSAHFPLIQRNNYLRERREFILLEINNLGSNVAITSEKRRQLCQEYNTIVDEEMVIYRRHFRDPLDVLPPELWHKLLPKKIDEILTLTLVSPSWHHKLISIPQLWTNIVLDTADGDYLARAAIGLHLSRPLAIDLRIEVPVRIWYGLYPTFVGECSRIRKLEILTYPWARLSDALEILRSFENLPVLRHMQLPFNQNNRQKHSYSLVLERLPSLTTVPQIPFSAQSLTLPAFQNLTSVTIYYFDQVMADALMELPKLKTLYLEHPAHGDRRLSTSKWTRRLLSSVTELFYTENNFNKVQKAVSLTLGRMLRCMTHNLVTLAIDPIHIEGITALLIYIQPFHSLRVIKLGMEQTRTEDEAFVVQSFTPMVSIKRLSLVFRTPLHILFARRSIDEKEEEYRDRAFNRVFSLLVTVMPRVEELSLDGWYTVEIALNYIRSLHYLESVIMAPTSSRLIEGSIPDSVEKTILPTDFLDRIDCRSLLSIKTSTLISLPHIRNLVQQPGNLQAMLTRYTMSSTALYTVTTLSLEVDFPILVDLITLPALQTFTFLGESVTFASDFFEELLLQPHCWPFLEHIRLMGYFVEWDILILMLERRNFLTSHGVKRIKTLEFHETIPYRLLHPLTRLLEGKLGDRDPISQYSITEIGKSLYNPKVIGCHGCLRKLLACDARAKLEWQDAGRILFGRMDWRLAWEYPLPHERIHPSPPISPDVLQWLTGKRMRRRKFVKMSKEIGPTFRREAACLARNRMRRSMVVESHSLDGGVFD